MGTKQYELAESEWSRIKDMLSPEHSKVGKRGRSAKYDNRSAMNWILWIARESFRNGTVLGRRYTLWTYNK